MINILTALFYEAKPYIEMLHLKRASATGGLQLFEGDGYRLAIGGTGPVSASVATAYLLTRYPPGSSDVFVNVGTAGSSIFPIGEIVLCKKIVNTFTRRELYPEMLFRHPFQEGILGSVGEPTEESLYDLTDMEGAFVYESALIFLQAAQIHCLKIISDNLCPGSVTKELIGKLMSETVENVCNWLDSIVGPDNPPEVFTDEDKCILDMLTQNLKLTFAMEQKLRQVCRQAKIRQVDIASVLSEGLAAKPKVKNEGKAVFVKLLNMLSEAGGK